MGRIPVTGIRRVNVPDKTIGGYRFKYACDILPHMENGKIWSDRPQDTYKNPKNLRLNENGKKEYCRFNLDLPSTSGVYAWVLDGIKNPLYIGKTVNLRKRFGSTGYGHISPRNCYVGGQSTNCKMNNQVLEHARQNEYFQLFFRKTDDYDSIEKELIEIIDPVLNERK